VARLLGAVHVIARITGVALGIWLMAAPAVLEYGGDAATSDRIAGPIGGSLALVAASQVLRPLRWTVIPVGAWLVIAPLVLGYDIAAATVNSVVCGTIFIATAFWRGQLTETFGGGWSVLWSRHPA
jgi:hypothetical protein